MGYRNWGYISYLDMDEKGFMEVHVFRNPEFPSPQKNIVFLENREFTYFHKQFNGVFRHTSELYHTFRPA